MAAERSHDSGPAERRTESKPAERRTESEPADRTTGTAPAERILALDVGDRRIGLAITDPLGIIAQPLFTLHRTQLRADLKAIARFIRQHGVTTVLVGHPLHSDGSPSAQGAKAVAFAAALRHNHPTLTHLLWDERLTTLEAHALLDQAGHGSRSAGRSHGRPVDRKDRIDQVAATLLLESFLANGRPALLPDPDGAADPDTAGQPDSV